MALIELFLFSLALSAAFTFSFPIARPLCRAFISLIAGIGISLIAYVDARLVVVGVLLGGLLLLLSKRPHGLIPLTLSLTLSVVLLLTPHVDDLLYLQSRYIDNFQYVSDGMYYSERLKQTFLVSRRYGDTYQACLYKDYIVANVKGHIPTQWAIRSIAVTPVQTRELFFSPQDFADATQPVVHVYAAVPSDVSLDEINLPYQTKVVPTL